MPQDKTLSDDQLDPFALLLGVNSTLVTGGTTGGSRSWGKGLAVPRRAAVGTTSAAFLRADRARPSLPGRRRGERGAPNPFAEDAAPTGRL